MASRPVEVIRFYCYDDRFFRHPSLGFRRTGGQRAKFLTETVNKLKETLEALALGLIIGNGSRIFFRYCIKNERAHLRKDFVAFERWRIGRTGNNFVDANMRELLQTGYISNRGRQNAASFLEKDLNTNWQWGAS